MGGGLETKVFTHRCFWLITNPNHGHTNIWNLLNACIKCLAKSQLQSPQIICNCQQIKYLCSLRYVFSLVCWHIPGVLPLIWVISLTRTVARPLSDSLTDLYSKLSGLPLCCSKLTFHKYFLTCFHQLLHYILIDFKPSLISSTFK